MTQAFDSDDELVIRAGQANRHYWGDLWRFRELFYFFVWRDFLVRYKQTVIGVSWAGLRPLLTMAVFTVVFGRLAGLPADGVPYPILVFVAMLPWQFFANAITECSNSLINDADLISKIYFPRLTIPASAVTVNLVDLAISALILLVLLGWYDYPVSWRLAGLPLFVLLTLALSFGAGVWFAALNVQYRDVRYIVPFVVQLGLFLSPVGFSSAVVPDAWRLLYSLNPMVGAIDGFRWAILGTPMYWPGLVMSLLLGSAVVVGGLWYFRRTERAFADVI